MQLRFIKVIAQTVCYGVSVKTGDVIDSAVWYPVEDVMIAKALRSGDWQEVDGVIESDIDAPKKRGRKPKQWPL